MEVEIVAVGNELLLGETIDTNSAYLGRRLAAEGARVVRVSTVGDDHERLARVLGEARDRGRWIVVTGGLGPTHDDVTREVVAEVFDRKIVVDPEQLAIVTARFRSFGYAKMPESNHTQAEVPEGARVLPNERGTAPGLVLEEGSTRIYVLPGVPGEMMGLVERFVAPEIRAAAGPQAEVIRSRVVRTVGIGESALAERLADIVEAADPVEIAFLPHLGAVDVRLTVAGLRAVDRRLDALVSAITERAARWTYGCDDQTLGDVVGTGLRDRGWTVGVAESCTGGGLGAALTASAGSSDYFVGGVVAYHDSVKRSLLGVPAETLENHGAVSVETCRAMAEGIRQRLAVDVGCGITGVAGPGGGTESKPVGLTHVAVCSPAGFFERRLTYPGTREENRERATLATMALLLEAVRGPAVGTDAA